MPARAVAAEIRYYVRRSPRSKVGNDPLDLDLSVFVKQGVPLVAPGGDDAQTAGYDLSCELSQAPRRIHVLVDAVQIRRRAEELHVLGQVASDGLEILIGPCFQVGEDECDGSRFRFGSRFAFRNISSFAPARLDLNAW